MAFIAAELGDFDPSRHLPGYVSEFDLVPQQTERFNRSVEELHRRLTLVLSVANYIYLGSLRFMKVLLTILL